MAKTEVILIHNVAGLGGESDRVRVAAGYARNFLFPQRLAIPLTAANQRRLDALRKRRVERESRELSTMTELAQTLSKITLVLAAKAGEDGKMFGSVTAGTIADELKHQYDATVEKKRIHLQHPIKKLGDYEVELRLHPQVTTTLKVRVESTTPGAHPPGAAPAQAAPAAPETDKPQAEQPKKERSDRRVKAAKAEKAGKAV
jgi:large subunit ribosomal protein L9